MYSIEYLTVKGDAVFKTATATARSRASAYSSTLAGQPIAL